MFGLNLNPTYTIQLFTWDPKGNFYNYHVEGTWIDPSGSQAVLQVSSQLGHAGKEVGHAALYAAQGVDALGILPTLRRNT